MQRQGQGPSLGLFQLPKQSLGSSEGPGSEEREKGPGYPSFPRPYQLLTLLVLLLPGYVQSCFSFLIHCEGSSQES